MKLDIKKLSDELGLSYEIDETQTIRCAYCDCYILRYDPNIKATKTFDDIFYKTRNKFKLEKIEKRKEDLCKDF